MRTHARARERQTTDVRGIASNLAAWSPRLHDWAFAACTNGGVARVEEGTRLGLRRSRQ